MLSSAVQTSPKGAKRKAVRMLRTPKKAAGPVKSDGPVQLTIFDYATAIGVALLPDAS